MKKSKMMRLLSLLMALLFLWTSAAPCVARAEIIPGGAKDEKGNTLLTSVTIGGLDEPKAGTAFDEVATVSSAQGISWNIPVIWVNSAGVQVHCSSLQEKYLPVFVFYLPKGYTIAANAVGKADIKLPAFVNVLFGKDAATTMVYDPAVGVSFLTGGPTAYGGTSAYWSSNSGGSSGSSSSSASIAPAQDNKQEEVDLVTLYCDKTALREFDREFLENLINLIRNEIEPKAVNLLQDRFPAFKNANANELSKEIGLYIYHGTGYIDGEKAMEGALAFVSGNYAKNKNDQFTLLMGVNTKAFAMQKNPETGKLELTERGRIDLDNTIVHEMLHAFMDDYLRFGMVNEAYDVPAQPGKDPNNGFPYWFIEGSATTVDNVYQFRYKMLQELSTVEDSTYDKKLGYYTGKFDFNVNSVYDGYTNKELTGNDCFDLDKSKPASNDKIENTASAYVSGYLACVYLGAMAANYLYNYDPKNNASLAVWRGKDEAPERGNLNYGVNLGAITAGLNYIFEEAHNGKSLSEIVNTISQKSLYNNQKAPEYNDLKDFQYYFIKGDGRDTYNESREFVADYLQYLNYCVPEGKVANGSILFDDQNFGSPLAGDISTETDIYKINQPGRVVSTADDKIAYNGTGGVNSANADDRDHENDKDDTSTDDGEWDEYDEEQYDEEVDEGKYDDNKKDYIKDDTGDGDDDGDGNGDGDDGDGDDDGDGGSYSSKSGVSGGRASSSGSAPLNLPVSSSDSTPAASTSSDSAPVSSESSSSTPASSESSSSTPASGESSSSTPASSEGSGSSESSSSEGAGSSEGNSSDAAGSGE